MGDDNLCLGRADGQCHAVTEAMHVVIQGLQPMGGPREQDDSICIRQ